MRAAKSYSMAVVMHSWTASEGALTCAWEAGTGTEDNRRFTMITDVVERNARMLFTDSEDT